MAGGQSPLHRVIDSDAANYDCPEARRHRLTRTDRNTLASLDYLGSTVYEAEKAVAVRLYSTGPSSSFKKAAALVNGPIQRGSDTNFARGKQWTSAGWDAENGGKQNPNDDEYVDSADIVQTLERGRHEEPKVAACSSSSGNSATTSGVAFFREPGRQYVQGIMVLPKTQNEIAPAVLQKAEEMAADSVAAARMTVMSGENYEAVTASPILGTVYEVYARCALQARLSALIFY